MQQELKIIKIKRMFELFKRKKQKNASRTDAKPDKCFEVRRNEFHEYLPYICTHSWTGKNLMEEKDWNNGRK